MHQHNLKDISSDDESNKVSKLGSILVHTVSALIHGTSCSEPDGVRIE